MNSDLITLPQSKISGQYKLVVRDRSGSIVNQIDWFDNLIVDNGLDSIFTSTQSTPPYRCHIGDGTTPATTSDLGLVSQLYQSTLRTDTRNPPINTPPYYTEGIYTFRFTMPSFDITITEVGISTYNRGFFSRALIQDSFGNPISLTIPADFVLDVQYKLRNYPALISGDYVQTININGTNHTFTWRAAYCGVYLGGRDWGLGADMNLYGYPILFATNGSLGAITGVPSGTQSAGYAISIEPYISGSFYKDINIRYGLNDANYASGISAVFTYASIGNPYNCVGFAYQAGISPAIPKTAYDLLTITLRISFGRY